MRARLLAIVCLSLAASLPAQTLIHYYDFNGSTVTDLAGSANGTLVNGAMVSGGVLVLNGTNGYVDFATKLVPESGTFSVAFFAQAPALLSDNNAEIISQGSNGGPGFYFGYNTDVPIHIRIGDNINPSVNAFPTDGLMHHYAVTVNNTNTFLYIDGALYNIFGLAITLGGSENTRIGAQYLSFGEYFGGSIDEMRIYTGTLSDIQVAALAAIPEPSAIAGLFGAVALAVAGCSRRRRLAV